MPRRSRSVVDPFASEFVAKTLAKALQEREATARAAVEAEGRIEK